MAPLRRSQMSGLVRLGAILWFASSSASWSRTIRRLHPSRLRSRPSARPLPERRRPRTPLIAAGAALGVLVLGTIVYVASNTGRNKIENQDHADSDRIQPRAPRRFPRLSTAIELTAPALLPNRHQPGGVFAQSLFNGSDLKGWEVEVGDARMWRVENQTLVATEPEGQDHGAKGLGRLLTERGFKEFIFRFEYQSSSDSKFGVVWWTLPGEMPPVFHPSTSKLGLATNRGGLWIFRNLRPIELKGGEGWNLVEIEARDRLIRISVNGKQIVRQVLHEKPAEPTALKAIKPDGAFPRIGMDRRSGRLGFQFSNGTGRFRNIEIEELPPSTVVERPLPKSAVEAEEHPVEEAADLPDSQPTAPGDAPK